MDNKLIIEELNNLYNKLKKYENHNLKELNNDVNFNILINKIKKIYLSTPYLKNKLNEITNYFTNLEKNEKFVKLINQTKETIKDILELIIIDYKKLGLLFCDNFCQSNIYVSKEEESAYIKIKNNDTATRWYGPSIQHKLKWFETSFIQNLKSKNKILDLDKLDIFIEKLNFIKNEFNYYLKEIPDDIDFYYYCIFNQVVIENLSQQHTFTAIEDILSSCINDFKKEIKINIAKDEIEINLQSPKSKVYELIKNEANNKFNKINDNQIQPWYALNIGKKLEIKTYTEKEINYNGIGFEGTPSVIFWNNYIEPFLKNEIQDTFKYVTSLAKEHQIELNSAVEDCSELLKKIVEKSYQKMYELNKSGITPEKLNQKIKDMENFIKTTQELFIPTKISSNPSLDFLTLTERKVFNYLVSGHTAKSIAEKFHNAETTIITHRTNILRKLNLKNLEELRTKFNNISIS